MTMTLEGNPERNYHPKKDVVRAAAVVQSKLATKQVVLCVRFHSYHERTHQMNKIKDMSCIQIFTRNGVIGRCNRMEHGMIHLKTYRMFVILEDTFPLQSDLFDLM